MYCTVLDHVLRYHAGRSNFIRMIAKQTVSESGRVCYCRGVFHWRNSRGSCTEAHSYNVDCGKMTSHEGESGQPTACSRSWVSQRSKSIVYEVVSRIFSQCSHDRYRLDRQEGKTWHHLLFGQPFVIFSTRTQMSLFFSRRHSHAIGIFERSSTGIFHKGL